MSDASVLQKIKTLKEQKDDQGILDLIETLARDEMSPQIWYEKIAANINLPGTEHLQKTLQLFGELDNMWADTTVRNFMVAALRLRMSQPIAAFGILQGFNAEVLEERQAAALNKLFEYTKNTLVFPHQQKIIDKIRVCWETFAGLEAEIREHLENNDLARANIMASGAFGNIVDEGLFIIIEKYDGKPYLVISNQGFRHTVPIIRLFSALAPQDILAKWSIDEGFRYRNQPLRLPPGADGVSPILKFGIADDHGIRELLVASDSQKTMPMLPLVPLVRSLMANIMQQTGEAAFTQCFGITKIVDEIPESVAKLTVEDIIARVKTEVPNWETFTFKDLLDTEYETHYPVKVEANASTTRKRDVVYLKTNQPWLMVQRTNKNLLPAQHLENFCAQPVYFAFRTQAGPLADQAILQRIVSDLSQVTHTCAVMGYAHGQVRVYLDVLAWDLDETSTLIRACLEAYCATTNNALIDFTLYPTIEEAVGMAFVGAAPNTKPSAEFIELSNQMPRIEPFDWFGEPNVDVTDEEIFDMVEDLYKQGQIDDVRLLLINMPAASLTKRARLMLSIAKLITSQRDRGATAQEMFAASKIVEECVETLKAIEDELAGAVDFECLHGIIDYMMSHEGPAIDHFEAALVAPDAPSVYFSPDEIKQLRDRCVQVVSSPKFGMNFYHKCQVLRQFLVSLEDSIHELEETVDHEKLANETSTYSKMLRQFFEGLDISIKAPSEANNQIQITMNAHEDQTVAFEMVLLRQGLREPGHDWDIRLEGVETNADGVYEPTEHMHYVQMDPKELTSRLARQDVYKAYTMTPELWLDFKTDVNTHADLLHNHGLVPLMLMIPHKNENDATRLAELDRLATALVMTFPDEVAHYTGKSLGLEYDYIDFMVANGQAFLQLSKKCFEEEGIANVRYRAFRTHADEKPLTFDIQKLDEEVPPNTMLN